MIFCTPAAAWRVILWKISSFGTGAFMKQNMKDREQKIRMAIGSAAAATAIYVPLSYKWKGVLTAIAVGGLLTGALGRSPLKRIYL
jgi:hypothetical protein